MISAFFTSHSILNWFSLSLFKYAFFLILVFIAELTTGILAVVFQERARAEIKLNLVHKLRNNYGENSAFTAAIDLIQTKVAKPLKFFRQNRLLFLPS